MIKLASNTPIFERMRNDLDLSAGGVIDGTETIDEVGQRVFEEICRVASGDAGQGRRTQAPRISILGRANRVSLDRIQDFRCTGSFMCESC